MPDGIVGAEGDEGIFNPLLRQTCIHNYHHIHVSDEESFNISITYVNTGGATNIAHFHQSQAGRTRM